MRAMDFRVSMMAEVLYLDPSLAAEAHLLGSRRSTIRAHTPGLLLFDCTAFRAVGSKAWFMAKKVLNFL